MNANVETDPKESAITLFLKTVTVKANASDKKAAAGKFKAFQAKKKAMQDALKALENEEQDAARAVLAAFGKVRLTVDGIDYVPTCREDRIFYKEMGAKGLEI